MKLTKAEIMIHDGVPCLMLVLPHSDIISWLEKYEHRLPLDIDISVRRKARSMDANSYLWVLCDRIAAEIGITKEEVYRQHIREVGVFDDIAVAEAGTKTFIDNFESNGVGWIAEVLPCKLKGCDKVRCYYGSSTYDSKQMSRLIDSVIDTAKEYQIETLPPDELERMIGKWE